MPTSPNSEDWFSDAATAAASSPKARAARERAQAEEETFRKAVAATSKEVDRLMPRPLAAAEAMSAFTAAMKSVSGGLGVGTSAPPSAVEGWSIDARYARPRGGGGASAPRPATTPEQALEIIVEAVRNDEDPFSAVGFWISKLTMALTAIQNEKPEE